MTWPEFLKQVLKDRHFGNISTKTLIEMSKDLMRIAEEREETKGKFHDHQQLIEEGEKLMAAINPPIPNPTWNEWVYWCTENMPHFLDVLKKHHTSECGPFEWCSVHCPDEQHP